MVEMEVRIAPISKRSETKPEWRVVPCFIIMVQSQSTRENK